MGVLFVTAFRLTLFGELPQSPTATAPKQGAMRRGCANYNRVCSGKTIWGFHTKKIVILESLWYH